MELSYFFNKLIYQIFEDWKVKYIEEILECEIINGKGIYYPKFTGYLSKNTVNLEKINKLESTIKHHVEIKHENYNYIIKVYHRELPSFIQFEYLPTNEIYLGQSYDGGLKISFNEYTNMIIGGTTGSGKSNLISSILLNLKCDKIYIDNKGGADNPLLNYIEVITNIDDGINKLKEINNLIEERLSQLRKNKKTKFKRLIIVIDEFYPYTLRKDKKEIYSLIGTMMSRCRVAKINFILCSQRVTSEIIPTLITANIDIRIAMRTASQQESINIIRVPDSFYIKEKGIGYVNLNGDLKKFKSAYVDEDKISDYLPKIEESKINKVNIIKNNNEEKFYI